MVENRTIKQNKAIHVYFKELADCFNEAGLDMKTILKPEIDIEWTTESVKDYIWRPIMKAMYNIDSTTEMNPVMVSRVYEQIDKHLASKFKISIPFPSLDNVILIEDEEEKKAELKNIAKQMRQTTNADN